MNRIKNFLEYQMLIFSLIFFYWILSIIWKKRSFKLSFPKVPTKYDPHVIFTLIGVAFILLFWAIGMQIKPSVDKLYPVATSRAITTK